MKVTKARLKQIIKEEISFLFEGTAPMESKMSCEMKGGTWHSETGDGPGQGECSFGDVADRPHLNEQEEKSPQELACERKAEKYGEPYVWNSATGECELAN